MNIQLHNTHHTLHTLHTHTKYKLTPLSEVSAEQSVGRSESEARYRS
jgi:hypothetical protein